MTAISEHQQWHAAVVSLLSLQPLDIPTPLLSATYLESVQQYLTSTVAPRFSAFFQQYPEMCSQKNVLAHWAKKVVPNATNEVCRWVMDVCESHFELLSKKAPSVIAQTRVAYARLCEAALARTPYFSDALVQYLDLHFCTFESEPDRNISAVSGPLSHTWRNELVNVCTTLWRIHLGRVLVDCATALLLQHLETRVRRVRKVHNAAQLPSLSDWLQHSALAWLSEVLPLQSTHFSLCSKRLYSALYTLLADLRIAELFDVIVDWPESRPAVVDLKECLSKTSAHNDLVVTLQRTFRQRVLHCGASTQDITECYVKTVRALTVLDPSGVLLHAVCPTLQRYLRQRPDTVRTIVTLLTHDGEGNFDLFGEFEETEDATTVRDTESSEDDESEHENGNRRGNRVRWSPQPLYAQPGADPQSQPPIDILSMLINIYGSKELFVNEYITLLAERLLNTSTFETDRELRHVELLKKKFGENNMRSADIMLKDIADSKRLNAYINQHLNTAATLSSSDTTDIPLTAIIVSGLFWPPFRDEPFSLHPRVQRRLDTFSEVYQQQKQSRKLVWKTHVGTVEMEISFAGSGDTQTFTVSPLLATIILHFQDRAVWSLTELAAKVGVSCDFLKRKIVFWIHNGVIQESENNVYQLRNGLANGTSRDNNGVVIEEESGENGTMVDSGDNGDAEMNQLTEMYVINMLKNLGPQPLDKLHNILSNYVPGFQKTASQLAAFLDALIKQDKIDFVQSLYSLKK
jgi:anaphase-promoting complex subunit 2